MTQRSAQLLQLHISLADIEPLIWRRIVVPDTVLFVELAWIILIVMGWENRHLHEFRVGSLVIGDPSMDGEGDFHDETVTPLNQVIDDSIKQFGFCYDFGDDWWHQIVIEARLPDDGKGVRLLDGQNACPPEDCGGVPGYFNLVEVMREKKHPEYKDLRAWLGRSYDPTVFKPVTTRKLLREFLTGSMKPEE